MIQIKYTPKMRTGQEKRRKIKKSCSGVDEGAPVYAGGYADYAAWETETEAQK